MHSIHVELGQVRNEARPANIFTMAHCCVVFCTNDERYEEKYLEITGKTLHFHKFPKDAKRKKEWIVAIRRDEGKDFKVSKRS